MIDLPPGELGEVFARLERLQRHPVPGTLAEAAAAGDLEAMTALLDAGAPVDGGFFPGEALYRAAKAGHAAAIALLRERGARLPEVGPPEQPLAAAAGGGHLEAMRTLMADPSWPRFGPAALHRAAGAGERDAALVLLAAAVDPNEGTSFLKSWPAERPSQAARQGGFDDLARLIDDQAAWPAAARELESQSRPPVDDLPALERRALAILAALPAPEKARDDAPAVADWSRLLAIAARAGSLALARALLERGVPADGVDGSGRSALHHASEGSPAIVDLLLRAGARVDRHDRTGWTPLARAAVWGDPEVVRLLLEAGAEARARTLSFTSPLLVARGRFREEIVELLRQAYDRTSGPERALHRHGRCRRDVPRAGLGRPWRHAGDFWWLLACEGSVGRVREALNGHFTESRLLVDVAERRVPYAADSFALRLRGSPWTLLLPARVRYGEELASLATWRRHAAVLPRSLGARVCCLVGGEEALLYTVHAPEGEIERRDWEAFEPDQRAVAMRAFHRLDLYVPRCRGEGDGFDAWLRLYRHRRRDVEQLDALVPLAAPPGPRANG